MTSDDSGAAPIRRRRSLSQVGGKIETSGDREAARLLADAVDVVAATEEDAPDRAHVHGFHVYPARTHPVIARRLIEGFAPPKGTVLDPFCGSGTVLVEAMLAGRAARGTDLNPVAVRLATAKTFPRTKEKTEALVSAAEAVAAFAQERRKAKAGSTRRLPQEDVSSFQPHVLLELDGLRAGIEAAPPEHRPDLSLVLSSILVKVSTKRGDTSEEETATEKRIAAGYPSKLFVKRTQDLARRFLDFAALLPSPPPRARVTLDDASKLVTVEEASIDAIVTSPPYVATYDYLAHHAMRMRWLGLEARGMEKKEIGARRAYAKLSAVEAHATWRDELKRLFEALARVTKKGGSIVLLIADSAAGADLKNGRPVALRADAIVAEVAERGRKLVPVAAASQARPHFHPPTASAFRDRPRMEHALLLRRA